MDDKTQKQVAGSSRFGVPIRIVDPACGSGSFLIGAYQALLDWHLNWYVQDDPEKWATTRDAKLHRGASGDWQLTIDERKRILLTHIYGVDIDPQAVEVTKLSLLLKVLEGENEQTINSQFALFQERVLPDLSSNVRCGNSLIDSRLYDNHQASMFNEQDHYRINVFDWEQEFSYVFEDGGFDVVIGNPPYIRIQALKEFAPIEVEYYKERYEAAKQGNYDIYVVFVEKGQELLREGGHLGYILPHKFMNAKYGNPIRKLIADEGTLRLMVHFGDEQVFTGATTYTCLLFLQKWDRSDFRYVDARDLDAWRRGSPYDDGRIDMGKVTSEEWNFIVGDGAQLFERLEAMPMRLGDIANMFVGLQTSADTVFLFKEYERIDDSTYLVHSKELGKELRIEASLLKPVIRSGHIDRFWGRATAQVLFPYWLEDGKAELISEKDMEAQFPLAWAYLNENMELLANRESGKFRDSGWYQLYPKNLDKWEVEKLLIPYMVTRLASFYDDENHYFVNVTTGGFGVTLDQEYGSLKYFSGLINSALLNWYMQVVSTNFNSGYFAANKQYLVQLPIRPVNFTDPKDRAAHDKMVDMVDEMRMLKAQLNTSLPAHDKTVIERRTITLSRHIDDLVYDLYDVSDDETTVVENATRQ